MLERFGKSDGCLFFSAPQFGGVILAGLLLSACGTSTPYHETLKDRPVPVTQGIYKVGNPYRIKGILYTPAEDPDYDEVGIASWYGPNFHGKLTANGETFNQFQMTAAHPTLPMPSMVRVTNLENGRSVVVRLNDRGPFANDRIIDMSKRGAELLDFKRQGTARVRVTYLGPASLDPTPPPERVERAPATQQLAARPPAPAARPLSPAAPPAPVQAAPLSPQPVSLPANASPASDPIGALTAEVDTLLQTSPSAPAPVSAVFPEAPQVASSAASREPSIFVQVGAFSARENAARKSAWLSDYLGPTDRLDLSPARHGASTVYRVRVGPFPDLNRATSLLARLQGDGHNTARIVFD